MNTTDLLKEYRDPAGELMSQPALFVLNDMATLCAVAIARVQLLARRLGASGTA